MASVTSSLFGTLASMGSPETLLEQRVQQAYGGNRRPGDVFFNAAAGAGEQLLQSTQKLFGMESEQLKQQRKLQAIIQGVQTQVDVSTPDGLAELANRLNEFPEFSGIALAMRQEAAKAKLAANEAQLKEGLVKAQTATEGYRQTELASRAEKNLREPTAKEDKIKTPPDFAAAGISLGIPSKVNIADYTQEETARIRQQLQKDRESTARAGAPVPASGEVKIGDIASANTLVENLVKAPRENLSTVNQLRTLISQARKGEGAAVPQLQRQLVKLVGDSQIASAEARTALGSAGVVGDAFSYINTLFTGTPSAEKLNSVSKVIDALEQINANSYNQGRNRATALINEAKFSPETRKSLIPPEYKTGKQREKSKFIEGQIYQDAKGNKARYVNGQWVPVQ